MRHFTYPAKLIRNRKGSRREFDLLDQYTRVRALSNELLRKD